MDYNVVLVSVKDKIPGNSLAILSERLKNASNDKLQSIGLLNFKSPIVGLLLGIFFGALGIDRFYKGDVTLGAVKLGLFILGLITTFIYIGIFILFIVWVWAIVDLFLVFIGIKKDNLNKINSLLIA
ncbi:TM2 domain-containing protein [Campylobacter vicugnae]|uniref:TM2 domain-containing protein n=1 Tax=Campylobacter vicugnae TaxID=1660076 RepID=UPI0025502488|nr:TM2 domain-containing protein [Campylobacter ovis]MDL0095672.1 TM2 domain-containing protein [Campylobacter ovis]